MSPDHTPPEESSQPERSATDRAAQGPREGPPPWLRPLIEIGPLVVFFFANARWDLRVGTAAFMVAVIAALIASWSLERRIPPMPLVTAVFVMVFGGLTLYLDNDTFIKVKPTLVNLLFAAALFVGLAFGRSLLKTLLASGLHLDDEGWRKLTFRWGLFFVFLALVNEVVWRNFSSDFWVSFKLFGNIPLSMLFLFSQLGLIQRHSLEQGTSPD